jgi:hypothetical protein
MNQAVELMLRFAERTGLAGGGPQRRYLWTDAFATCNFLGLWQATGEARHRELALVLVDRVHHTLGMHRADDSRQGWLGGLDTQQGEAHPTCGGLRIGKRLPERRPGEPLDERLEWDRDGQYFHYLTKWMHALDQVTRATGYPTFNQWARELAATAHRAFVYDPRRGGGKRMYWKMSADLARPLVASMGQHDPLDGLVTCWQLDATAAGRPGGTEPSLAEATRDFGAMVEPRALATVDPLGLGGLLADAYRIAQLLRQGALATDGRLLGRLLAAAAAGVRQYASTSDLREPAERRLAFRELGLAIGLAAVSAMESSARGAPERFPGGPDALGMLGQLARHVPLGAAIEAFWLEPVHRRATTWLAHEDINDVMLATSLAPEGFLVLRPPP